MGQIMIFKVARWEGSLQQRQCPSACLHDFACTKISQLVAGVVLHVTRLISDKLLFFAPSPVLGPHDTWALPEEMSQLLLLPLHD